MKVIFLDVDGVLNCAYSQSRAPHGCIGVDDDKVKVLRKIIDATDAKIVLVSTWKQSWSKNKECQDDDANYLDRKLAEEGLQILDKTTDQVIDRGAGIRRWLDKYGENVDSWIVLDDDIFPDYVELDIIPHHVKTNFGGGGLMEKHVPKCVDLLVGHETKKQKQEVTWRGVFYENGGEASGNCL